MSEPVPQIVVCKDCRFIMDTPESDFDFVECLVWGSENFYGDRLKCSRFKSAPHTLLPDYKNMVADNITVGMWTKLHRAASAKRMERVC